MSSSTAPITFFVMACTLAGCGTDGPSGPGGIGGPGGSTPDAGAGMVDPPPPARGFQVVSPEVTIPAHTEVTYCYYFRTPNTDTMVIKRWSSMMSPGSHHMIMYTTASETMPAGTINTDNCGGAGGGNGASSVPSWTYATQSVSSEVVLPTNDGTGLPLGQEILAATPAYFQMHYLNPADQPIQVHVTLNADAYAVGTPYTRTAAYITYNAGISIMPDQRGKVESRTCNLPADIHFWLMSTHSHKQSVLTDVKDGAAASTNFVFISDNWDHPGAKLWPSAPFFTFASGKLTYECTYDNTGDNHTKTVTSGPSAQTNEMCMATGYYFPANKPLSCITL